MAPQAERSNDRLPETMTPGEKILGMTVMAGGLALSAVGAAEGSVGLLAGGAVMSVIGAAVWRARQQES